MPSSRKASTGGCTLTLIKQYIRHMPVKVEYEHVFVHYDDILWWDQLTHLQLLNVEVDSIAKHSLLVAMINRSFINSNFPYEDLVLCCGGRKILASPIQALYKW